MKRVLITGMSGTGKSTVIRALDGLGFKAVDTDYGGFTELAASSDPTADPDWLWNEDRIQRLLSTEDAAALFISGTARNQVKFYPQFDHVVLLSAPAPLIVERLATRTNSPYGKDPDDLARVLRQLGTVEPLLRRAATLEVDTSAPLDQVLETIVALVR